MVMRDGDKKEEEEEDLGVAANAGGHAGPPKSAAVKREKLYHSKFW